MGLLDAGGSGWCLRWSATASWVVYDGQHGRCSLVSARGPGDGGEVLKGSRFPRKLAGNPDSPQAVIFLTSITDVMMGS